jgi:hypothetical protein
MHSCQAVSITVNPSTRPDITQSYNRMSSSTYQDVINLIIFSPLEVKVYLSNEYCDVETSKDLLLKTKFFMWKFTTPAPLSLLVSCNLNSFFQLI